MLPLDGLSTRAAKKIRVVFTDIDDTLTTDGLLEAPAFDAMWRLHRAGIFVVPVTGRPAGWCDHIARMWPVAGVIGENGALYFRYDHDKKKFIRRYFLRDADRKLHRKKLESLARKILRTVPAAEIASDQAFRMFDLAIDFAEDVPTLSEAEIDRIVECFNKAGATAKVSSIHVNGWFGRYDKLAMIRRFAHDVLDLHLDDPDDNARSAYVGDSPNDEPAFAFFKNSVGVANVKTFEHRLQHAPRFVTKAKGGRGFAQVAKHLLRAF